MQGGTSSVTSGRGLDAGDLHCLPDRRFVIRFEPGERQPDSTPDQASGGDRPFHGDRIRLDEHGRMQFLQSLVDHRRLSPLSREGCVAHRTHEAWCHVRGNGDDAITP